MREFKTASLIMERFAKDTGITDKSKPQRRYLWTDAFGVCNFLSLYEESKDKKYLDLALELVDSVHNTLGKFREDDKKRGYISGLDEESAKIHPTIGGLRIGKKLPQRGKDEPFDEDLEWERDGQYFHYLTKWMHALSRVTQVTGEHKYNLWAMELAKTAFRKFVYFNGKRVGMYWKMSVDLSYPLVTSMGQHDPLDGFITCMEIERVAKENPSVYGALSLENEIDEFYFITKDLNLATADSLGLGGLLSDCVFLSWLDIERYEELFFKMLESFIVGMEYFIKNNYLAYPAYYRLAFRELGLAIGLKGSPILKKQLQNKNLYEKAKLYMDILEKFAPIGEEIENFWIKEENRDNETWIEHKDINEVMLATALLPRGFLEIKAKGV